MSLLMAKDSNLYHCLRHDDEVRFPLAQSSLYLYTDRLSEGLARTKKSEDELESLKSLIDRFKDEPRQERLTLVANAVFVHGLRFDDLTILLLEIIGSRAEKREGPKRCWHEQGLTV